MKDLRLGLVGPLPPPAGGMANQTRQLKELLEAEGISVTLVQTNAPYRPAWAGRVRGLRALFRIVPYLFSLWRCAGQVQLFHVMANSGWSWHLYAVPAIWIARWRGIPVLVNYRGGEAQAFLERSKRWVLPSLARVNALVVPSGFLKEVFASFGVHSEVVPNVVDLARFSPSPDWGTEAAGLRIVVARNLEPIYDVATAIRAFARVQGVFPDARLVVAGTGPERGRLESLVAELKLGASVEFVGRLDRDAMAELYRSAAVMLNSSLVDNMPNSVLESLASGVPVVSTRVGGVPYIVQDGQTALLVPPGEAQAMGDAICRLLRDRSLALALRQAGLQEVLQYRWQAVRGQLLAVYRRCLGYDSQPHPSV